MPLFEVPFSPLGEGCSGFLGLQQLSNDPDGCGSCDKLPFLSHLFMLLTAATCFS